MNCSDCQKNLTTYGALRLPDDEQAALAQHVSECTECAAALLQTQQLFQLLDRQEPAPANALAAFSARLSTEVHVNAARPVTNPAARALPLWFQKLWPARPLWAFCYSFVLLACGLTGGQLLPSDTLGLHAQPGTATSPGEKTALVCPVQSSPTLWLPATQFKNLS